MIAGLPMYDRPETEAANDRFWQSIRKALGSGPDTLSRDIDLWDLWQSPDLCLAQACSLPYRAVLKDKVTLVAAPVYDLPCPAGRYFSNLVVRADDPRETFEDYAQAPIAINDWLSQSGWSALWSLAQDSEVALGPITVTGGHRASAEAVATGKADLASIDAVSWRMISRWDGFASQLRILSDTPTSPSLPYITGAKTDPPPLFSAIRNALQDLTAQDRDLLCLTGITEALADDYLSLPMPPTTCFSPQNP